MLQVHMYWGITYTTHIRTSELHILLGSVIIPVVSYGIYNVPSILARVYKLQFKMDLNLEEANVTFINAFISLEPVWHTEVKQRKTMKKAYQKNPAN